MDSNYNPEVVPVEPIEPWPIHGGCEDNVLRKIQVKLSVLDKEKSTRGEIVEALQTIKPAIIGILSFFAFSAFAAVEPAYTPMWNVPGTVNVMTNHKEWVEAGQEYPLFIIELNEGETPSKWTNIELKGSTNNFTVTTAPWNEMVFWGATADNYLVDPQIPTHDWSRIFVSGKPDIQDSRKWIRVSNFTDWSETSVPDWTPRKVAVLICPTDDGVFRRGQGTVWCNSRNDNLIWTYLRFDSARGHETNPGTGKANWREIAPVRWYSKIPEWANQVLP